MNHLEERSVSWRHLLEVLPEEIVVVDSSGVIRHVSEGVALLTGYARDELVGQTVEVLVPSRYRTAHVVDRSKYSGAPSPRSMGRNLDLTILCHGDRELAVDVALLPLTLEGQPWVVAVIRDNSVSRAEGHDRTDVELKVIAAKMAGAVALVESEERFRVAFEDTLAPMLFADLEDKIMEVNDAFCKMVGFTREELFGHDSKLFTYPEDVGIGEETHGRMIRGEVDQVRYVKRYRHKDGRVITVEVLRSSARDAAGKLLYFVISERDVTDRVQRDHLLRLLAEVNKLAMFSQGEAEFLQKLCDVLVNEGGYALAWIGVTPGDGEDGVKVVCAAGTTDYLDGAMVSWWRSKESGLNPTGTALRTGVSQVVGNFDIHSPRPAWLERASQFGFGSSVTVPFVPGGRKAVLSIYARDVFAFEGITVEGLEEFVREAEFALAHVHSVRQTKLALEKTTIAMKSLRVTEQARTESEQRFRLAFEDNMAPMVFSDLEDRAIAVNDAFCKMVGFTREELLGHDSKLFTHPEDAGVTEESHRRLTSGESDQVRYTQRYLHRDGRVIVSEVSKSAARDGAGETLYLVSSERDATEERALTAQLLHQALHDPLTGLANRALFEDRLSQAHARVARQGGILAVLLLDLDDFKGVNDTHGHLIGDQLLVGLARRFELVTRSSDTLCRFGGDEFLYLAEGLTNEAEVEEVANRLLAVLGEPFSFAGVNLEQHASIGVAICDGTCTVDTECLQGADVALYEAKRQHRGHHTFFTASMRLQAVNHFTLAQELRRALHVGDLSMYYQPIVNLTTNEVVGFEALMRWRHLERGWVPPSVFIPLAEQSELIVELGSFALREAVAAALSWAGTSTRASQPYVAVNLSAPQFCDPDLVPMIDEVLTQSGLDPKRLVIEITESVALLDVAETMKVIEHLSRLGIGIALDDFGTGFSSLSYLVLLRPRIIKIDRYFVNPSNESVYNDTLLEMIISLGNKLHMTMIAEGIETQAQLEQLRDLNCELGQGFLFSPAVPADEAAALVDRVFKN